MTTPTIAELAASLGMDAPAYSNGYSLGQFWDELTKGTLWREYQHANPGEAAFITLHVQKKIAQQADFVPNDVVKTATGTALMMVYFTLPS